MQLKNDEEIQILMLRCQLNNHSLTGHLEGTLDNRRWEGCLIFPLPASSGVSLETARRATVVGFRTKTLVDLGFDYGSSVMGFYGPGFYHLMGKMMRSMLQLGGGR